MLLLVLRAALLGVFGAGAHLYGQSMLIDTFALDHQITGQRREGVLAASFSFVEKACSALAPDDRCADSARRKCSTSRSSAG